MALGKLAAAIQQACYSSIFDSDPGWSREIWRLISRREPLYRLSLQPQFTGAVCIISRSQQQHAVQQMVLQPVDTKLTEHRMSG